QHPLEVAVHPRLRDHPGAVAGADLLLVFLDHQIDRGGIDIAFFEQHRLQRADAELSLGQVGMIVLVRHGTSLADRATDGNGAVWPTVRSDSSRRRSRRSSD